MDSSDLQHALQLHFTPAMYALTQRQNSARPFHSIPQRGVCKVRHLLLPDH